MMVNDYHLKLEAETFKIDIYDTNFLPFFLFPRPLISPDQMLMYIIFYFPWCVIAWKKNRRDAFDVPVPNAVVAK